MEMIDLPISERSEYVRFLLTLLVKKYHVNVRALSLDIDIADKVLYKFLEEKTFDDCKDKNCITIEQWTNEFIS